MTASLIATIVLIVLLSTLVIGLLLHSSRLQQQQVEKLIAELESAGIPAFEEPAAADALPKQSVAPIPPPPTEVARKPPFISRAENFGPGVLRKGAKNRAEKAFKVFIERQKDRDAISKASSELAKLIEEDPDNPRPYHFRARLCEIENDWPCAIRDYSKAIELEPANPVNYVRLARILSSSSTSPQHRDVTRALDLAKQAARLTERQKYYYLETLALCHLHSGDVNQAIEELRHAINVAPEREKPRLRKSIAILSDRK